MTRVLSSIFYISSIRKTSEEFNLETGEYQQLRKLEDNRREETFLISGKKKGVGEKTVWHDYATGIAHEGHSVNFIGSGESGEGKYPFYFLTDFPVTKGTVKELAEAGRRRWAILYELWFYANFSGQNPHTYCIAA